MNNIYALLRFLPWWALPAAFVVYELGVYFRRRKQRFAYQACLGLAGILILSSLMWFGFRGDLNSDRWVRAWLG